MGFRKAPFRFGYSGVRKNVSRWIISEQPKTYNDQVYPRLPFLIRSVKYKIKTSHPVLGNNPDGQLHSLAYTLTNLFKNERIKLNYNKAVEVRQQAERLIVEAMRNGDRHRPTMELANFWLLDKSLIHKLFKEFVPRYSDYSSAFTALHKLGKNYAATAKTITELKENNGNNEIFKMGDAILEMRGNNLPPIYRPKLDRPGLLTNILIGAAWKEQNQQNEKQIKPTS